MMKKIIFLILLIIFSTASYADELNPFKSDGCSAFPDGTIKQKQLWLKCCIDHDKSYWQGGSAVKRKAADFALQKCVASVGEPKIAILMLAGVRVGGSPYFPTKFRWGYGWPYLRGYKVLTQKEHKQVRTKLKEYEK